MSREPSPIGDSLKVFALIGLMIAAPVVCWWIWGAIGAAAFALLAGVAGLIWRFAR